MIEPGPNVVERTDLFRQRRLLLVLTFVLTAIHGLDVEIGTTVTAQGLVLTFKRPDLLLVSLWTAWAWSLYRYWQYQRMHTVRGLESARQLEGRPLIQAAVEEVLQKAIDAGQYAERGLKPGDRVACSSASGESFHLPDCDRELVYPNLHLHKLERRAIPVTGGGNCTLDVRTVRRIRRETERKVRMKYPFFTDIFVPYYFALLAPAALALDTAGPLLSRFRQLVH
jgi:hypothetical protein